jgi:hypothetical protein
MEWTNKPPTEPGWYWYKDPSEVPSIAYVYNMNHGDMLIQNCGGEDRGKMISFYPNRTRGQWSGPIPEPEE